MKKKAFPKKLLFIVLLIVVIALLGRQGFVKLYRLSQEKNSIVADNRLLKIENHKLAEQIEKLKKDDKYLERIAREELGMIGKNETVYQFEK